MVAHGTPCLGPVTHAGCGALCPAYDRGCYGCFGPKETPEHRRRCDALVGSARRPQTWSASSARSTPRHRRSARRAHAMSDSRRTRTIRTDYLARVEGEGAMHVRLDGGAGRRRRAADLRAAAVLRGVPARPRVHRGARHHRADLRHLPGRLPDERRATRWRMRCGVEVDERPIRALRRLLYCGEWIESHALHVYMLHAPDFLGYASAIEMARDHREIVEQGAAAEEDRQRADGGRRRPRGPPDQRARRRLLPRADAARAARRSSSPLEQAPRDRARDRAAGPRRFDFPDFELELRARRARATPTEYPIDRGRIVSDRGLDIAPCASSTSTSSRSTSSTRTRCTPGCASAAPTCAARWRATASRSTGCAAGAGGGARGRARTRLPQPVPEHRRPRASSSSTPPTRRSR